MLSSIFSLTTLWWIMVVLYIPACVGLMVIVLLQKGKGVGFGGAFGMSGGGEAIFGPRSSRSLPQKLTYTMAGLFMILALLMSIISGKANRGAAPTLQADAEITAASDTPDRIDDLLNPEVPVPDLTEGSAVNTSEISDLGDLKSQLLSDIQENMTIEVTPLEGTDPSTPAPVVDLGGGGVLAPEAATPVSAPEAPAAEEASATEVKEVAPVDGSATEEAPADGSATEEAPADGSATEEAPADGSVTEEAPAETVQ